MGYDTLTTSTSCLFYIQVDRLRLESLELSTLSHDACPKCGGRKRTKNKQCASCRGYGRKRHLMPSGYIRVYVPGHPIANSDGYALEHRYVLYEADVELPNGRDFHVHHINGDKTDNRIENLRVRTVSNHFRGHAQERGFVRNQYGKFSPIRHPTD